MYLEVLGTKFLAVLYFVRYFRYIPFCVLRVSNLMRILIPNNRYILLPTTVFRYIPVHNTTESLHWDSETNDKMTAANQHLEQSRPKAAITIL
jgi:hypothetical protein